ncbi:SDR family NAD(P)-dependent oxidoreductase [Aquabacterium sp.]|uniref:SDR family NAD(P)-dependent oxidoreductase n=1 Tax=Aquabacterium sp. TaxID=1872578 RepID=UPI002E36FF4D|nr:SDR family NAD(P)-dependent oxidoreductase [Aquabacterium sp.]
MAVTVVGATGGFGEALVEAFTREGAQVTALARSHDRLQDLASTWGCRVLRVDLLALETLANIAAQLGRQDIVVFATGADVRKPFLLHSQDEMAQLVNVNLLGPIVLTRALADRCMKPYGVIAHIGGFGDGHLALPYYAVDAATRSALASLCQALRREFQLEGRALTVSYLCPEPADTAAERPFGPLWARMGAPLVSVDRVADFVLTALAANSPSAVMGRQTWWLSKANALCPALVDRLMRGQLGRQLKAAFGTPHPAQGLDERG